MIKLPSGELMTEKLMAVGPMGFVDLWLTGVEVVKNCKPRTNGLYLRLYDHDKERFLGARLTPEEAFTLGTALTSWSDRIKKEQEEARKS